MEYVLVLYLMFTVPDLGEKVHIFTDLNSCLRAGDAITHAIQDNVPGKGREAHYGCYPGAKTNLPPKE
jgi:hypothetical protein